MPTLSQIWAKVVQLLANFQQHRHTGTDSPKVSYLDLKDVPTSAGFYPGSIVGDAAGPVFPTGWSITYVSGPPYWQVNHTLGTADYVIIASATEAGGTPITANWYDKTSTSFRLYANSSAGGSVEANIDFVVFI